MFTGEHKNEYVRDLKAMKDMETDDLPQTVNEAVDQIMADQSLEEQVKIARLAKDNLAGLFESCLKIVLQCKKYSKPVGNKAVQ